MNREEALALFRLDEHAELAAAEKVYHNLQINISRRLQELPADSIDRQKLEAALQNFRAAIALLRSLDASATARTPQIEVSDHSYALNNPRAPHTRSSPIKLYAAIATILLATIGLGAFLLTDGNTEPTSTADTTSTQAKNSAQESDFERTQQERQGSQEKFTEHDETLEQLYQKWQDARDTLITKQIELEDIFASADAAANAPNLPPEESRLARERVQFILEYVVNEEYLIELDQILKQEPSSDQDPNPLLEAWHKIDSLASDAELRLARQKALDAALVARSEMTDQISLLKSNGLPQWPPDKSTIAGLFLNTSEEQIDRILGIISASEQNMNEGEFELAAEHYQEASFEIGSLELNPAVLADQQSLTIEELYKLGKAAIRQLRLTKPARGSALDYARKIDEIERNRPEAAELLKGIQQQYLALALKALSDNRLDNARAYTDSAINVGGNSDEIAVVTDLINAREKKSQKRDFKALQPFEEVEGITMITIPLGEFQMGAVPSTADKIADGVNEFLGTIIGGKAVATTARESIETPVHLVKISSWFAVGRSEVTVEQFKIFVEATGYVTDAEKRGFSYVYRNDVEIQSPGKNWRHDYLGDTSSPNMPVIHVSYHDATAFTDWLSTISGGHYRLLSESEYEYVAKVGDQGGAQDDQDIRPNSGNFRGEKDPPPAGWDAATGRRAVRSLKGYGDGAFGPAAVGTYSPNRFGIDSIRGNVAEWTADCYTQSYQGKGTSQQPVTTGNCSYRMIRGGDWATDARQLRLSYRFGQPEDYSSNRVGFRVARDVEINSEE